MLNRERVRAHLEEAPGTARDIAAALELPVADVSTYLRVLVSRGEAYRDA